MVGDPIERKEQRLGKDRKEAPIDNGAELGIDLAENVDIFRPDEEREGILRTRAKAGSNERYRLVFARKSELVGVSTNF